MRVADYIVERLATEGVYHIFMITGRGILYLSDAVAKSKNINGICVHHEQAAAYAAVAYSQSCENIGACLVSTGCASTNTITGVLCAWQDGIPCIFISGQNMLRETTNYTKIPIRTYGQQEADIVNIVKPITKYAVMITNAEDIAYEIDKAIYLAKSDRKGPVWIDVPLDIQNMRIEPDELRRFNPEKIKNDIPTNDDVYYLEKELNNSLRPVILIGSGVRSSNSIEELEKFIMRYNIPVVFSPSAADTYGSDNSLSIGTVGIIGGTRAGNFALQNSDLILVLGSRLSSMITGEQYDKFARSAKVIVVDIDPIEYSKKTIRIDKLIIADIRALFSKLSYCTLIVHDSGWSDKCMHWKKTLPRCDDKNSNSMGIDLYYLAECLSESLPDNSIFLCDAGFEELILPAEISFRKGQRCIHPVSQGAMGFALPAAIGSYYSAANKTVVTVIGDGSIMMNLQELQTIKHNNIPIKIIINNNNCYAVIRKRQHDLFRRRTIGTDKDNGVSCPDFKKVADCFGIQYLKIENINEVLPKLKILMNTDGPVICEINGDPNQKYLHSGYARTVDKRIIQRPIEDQEPFMDRNLFLSEMIIEPIDQ